MRLSSLPRSGRPMTVSGGRRPLLLDSRGRRRRLPAWTITSLHCSIRHLNFQ
jgi:hypothetical protein